MDSYLLLFTRIEAMDADNRIQIYIFEDYKKLKYSGYSNKMLGKHKCHVFKAYSKKYSQTLLNMYSFYPIFCFLLF